MDENENYRDVKFLTNSSSISLNSNFAIITAYNPMDELLNHKINKAKNKELYKYLQKFRKKIILVIGCSHDLIHQEPGFLIDITLEDALRIGKEFQQRAIFWIEKNELEIIYCVKRQRIKIGKFSSRIEITGLQLQSSYLLQGHKDYH